MKRVPDDPMHQATQGGARREPRMGWLDGLRFDEGPARRTPVRHGRGTWWIALAAALLVVFAVVALREPIADRIWPQARAQALRQQAAQALARGHLTAGDGSGARELYEAAIAIDPDRNEARDGLMRVGATALDHAEAALRGNDFAAAHRALSLARELSVPRARADAIAARLRQREAEVSGIDGLLRQAAAARGNGVLDGTASAALPLYQRILALQPDRVEALEGREDAIADLLQRARADLDAGRLERGAARIDAARGYDAGHVDLPEARSRLARAVEQARTRAERERQRGRLADAAQAYRALLAIDAGDAVARRGLEAVAQAHARRAERLASDFDFAAARAALDEARALSPGAPFIAAAGQHIERARQSRMRLAQATGTRGSARRVQALLRDAAAAEARGDLLTPPGDSAYDKLRAARALAPADPGVRRASARLLPAARQCFERELRANSLGRARACLDATDALGEGASAQREARRRLAQRWIAVGEERLAAGELTRASAAARAARELDAGAPGSEAFNERLRTATATQD